MEVVRIVQLWEFKKRESALAGALVFFGPGSRQLMFSAPCQTAGAVLIGDLIWGWDLSPLAMCRVCVRVSKS